MSRSKKVTEIPYERRRFIVKADTPDEAVEASGIPKEGDAHPHNDFLLAQKPRVKPGPDGDHYVYVDYAVARQTR